MIGAYFFSHFEILPEITLKQLTIISSIIRMPNGSTDIAMDEVHLPSDLPFGSMFRKVSVLISLEVNQKLIAK